MHARKEKTVIILPQQFLSSDFFLSVPFLVVLLSNFDPTTQTISSNETRGRRWRRRIHTHFNLERARVLFGLYSASVSRWRIGAYYWTKPAWIRSPLVTEKARVRRKALSAFLVIPFLLSFQTQWWEREDDIIALGVWGFDHNDNGKAVIERFEVSVIERESFFVTTSPYFARSL